MPRVAIETLGCKVNQYESDQILARFAAEGFEIVSADTPADVYVVNTCSVTQVAEAKSRKAVRRMARLNPRATVVVTGCDVEMARRVGRAFPSGTLLVPNARKLDLVREVLQFVPGLRERLKDELAPAHTVYRSRVRTVIKVQDGCDMFCSYCSVPYTRGPVKSRPLAEITSEVAAAVACGHREIVLTGVLVGSYGTDLGDELDLADVMLAVAAVPGVERVRLSSIEPVHVSQRLLAVFARERKVCPHLHIPLQSGDDDVLRAMGRPYTSDDYVALCCRAQEQVPDMAITTDILVGFPGETEEAHRRTMAVAETVGFARMHVFRYSRRPGTLAADMPDQVDEKTKAARSQEMVALGRELRQRFAARHIGRVLEVMAEPGADAQHLVGYTPNYIRVVFSTAGHEVGETVSVRLLRALGDWVEGEAVGAANDVPLRA